ncbi:extracellular solute-binding protein [Spongiactinospora sp. TRM90649]|uniref:extracellular solute-binding protein n=1 Tax=Spongiactinospora sp. TRM90649 TaxID=3031114 RepID=UPI0023F86F9D|nr:extracellular solute-binding protein [Spongiactinospora sp. TRM90649]MDF5752394.1 extracellular solute-binding protein [Spongiactinospora sp. TRM90649]
MRRAAVLIPLALLACAAVSCSGQALPNEPGGDCVLVVATGLDVSGDVRKRLLEDWNGRHGNEAKACFSPISPVADEQRSEMMGEAQSGGGRYDVYNLDIQSIAEFAADGRLAPLDTSKHEPVADIPDAIWRAGAWEGTQYAAPFNTDAPLLLYRRDLVPGPPSDWAGMLAATNGASVLRASKGRPPRTGFAGQFAPYEGLVVNAFEAVWAAGGDVVAQVDGENRVVLDSPKGRQGITNLIKAVTPGPGGAAPPVPVKVLWHREGDSLAEMRGGDAVFARAWAYGHKAVSAGEAEGAEGMDIGTAPLPWRGVLGGQYLAVSANSGNQDLAQSLVAWLTRPDAATELYQCGGFAPPRLSALTRSYSCPDAPTAGPEPTAGAVPAETLRAALANARPRPATPYYPQFSLVFQTELHRLLRCHASGTPPCPSAEAFTAAVKPKLQEALSGHVGGP